MIELGPRGIKPLRFHVSSEKKEFFGNIITEHRAHKRKWTTGIYLIRLFFFFFLFLFNDSKGSPSPTPPSLTVDIKQILGRQELGLLERDVSMGHCYGMECVQFSFEYLIHLGSCCLNNTPVVWSLFVQGAEVVSHITFPAWGQSWSRDLWATSWAVQHSRAVTSLLRCLGNVVVDLGWPDQCDLIILRRKQL